jgi:glycosyltransferase involved in cell wall biosynthesis
MALGTPAVVSEIPATREVIDETGALFVPPGAPNQLAKAIATVLIQPEAAAQRAAAARARFLDRFTVARAADGMLAFYERALAARR